MKDEIHIGEMIRAKMKEERRSANWLAKKISCRRENVYKILKKSHIDTALLLKISQALNYDFFKDIPVILD